MPTWTTIGLSVLAGVLLCLGVLYIVLRWTLTRFLKGLMSMAEAHPLRISTQPKSDEEKWHNETTVSRARSFFEGQGYEWVQDFEVKEIDQLFLSSLVHRDGSAAVIYDHPEHKSWIDLVALENQLGHLTVSSSPLAKNFENPDFCQRIILEETEAQTLLKVFRERQAQIPEEQRRALTADNFQSELETAYANEVDWRHSRGGPTREEIKKNLIANQQKHTESEVESIWELQNRMASANLEAGLTLRFLAAVSAEDKLKFREDTTVVISDQSSTERIVEILSEHIFDEEFEATGLPSPFDILASRPAFREVQELIPEPARFKYLGCVDFPVKADFYLSPQGTIPVEIFPHRRIPIED